MTKFAQKSFSVASPGTKDYRDKFDQINWGTPELRGPNGERPIALKAVCGKCTNVAAVFHNPRGPIAVCAECLQEDQE